MEGNDKFAVVGKPDVYGGLRIKSAELMGLVTPELSVKDLLEST